MPGNSLVFQPTLHLTIMSNTPFFITPAHQIILKGVQLTPRNVNEIIKCVETHFYMIENKIAEACMHAIAKIEAHRVTASSDFQSYIFKVCFGFSHLTVLLQLGDLKYMTLVDCRKFLW